MQAQAQRWRVKPPISPSLLERFPHPSPLLAQLLYNRGITDPGAARSFLQGGELESNPFRMKGVARAVTRLRRAIRDDEPIAVFGDFDVDGVTATALLVQTLHALGAQVQPYIPHRVEEGYGLQLEALRNLYRQGVRVLVTVDCGIRAAPQIEQARRGLDIIVTDHHHLGPELPPALAVINPRQPDCPYPFEELAGVGVAFQLARALLRANARTPLGGPVALQEEDLLDLVALGTVADIVPLTDENRTLAKGGLERLNEPQRAGLQALMSQAGVQPGEVTANSISFILGPRLNAAGRLDTAMLSYQLLTSPSLEEAKALAERLEVINRERRRLTEDMLEQAREQVVAKPLPPLLFAAHESFHPGVVGLVASRLVEEFYRPAVVVGLNEGLSRGSARSILEFHITRAFDECEHLLERHGGHRMAGGFTIRNKNLPAFREQLLTIAQRELKDVDLVPKLDIDLEVELREMDWATQALVEKMEPCGEGNPPPLFLSRKVQLRRARAVGKEGRHLKMLLSDGRAVWGGIGFGLGNWAGRLDDRVDVVYTIEVNVWNGERRLQLNVQDLRPAE
ncbi:MAG: single-stranded-DNA-specific exonuclease RecJ [Chloroflexota bacterium]|nr:single-stranded-DNA-specific exonuclease RecJ [Chloroflexota bacterium]